MLGRALTVSLRDALVSVAGNALGLVAQVMLVAVGLGAVVAASATAYTALKIVGAAYVVWLGIQAIRHRGDARLALLAGERPPERATAALRTGFVVGVTNPKTIVFFVAFLPQFTSPGAPAGPAARRCWAWCSACWRWPPTASGPWWPAGRGCGSPGSRAGSTP